MQRESGVSSIISSNELIEDIMVCVKSRASNLKSLIPWDSDGSANECTRNVLYWFDVKAGSEGKKTFWRPLHGSRASLHGQPTCAGICGPHPQSTPPSDAL